MIRLLLFSCCILIGVELFDEYAEVDQLTLNMDWLPLAQRIVVSITAVFLVVSEYLKLKSFNITMMVFLLVLLIYNPFYFFPISNITKISAIVLFFIQALKTRRIS